MYTKHKTYNITNIIIIQMLYHCDIADTTSMPLWLLLF